jgi:hypothetical protein
MKENPELERLAAEQILDRGARMKMRAPLLFRLLGKKTISLVVRSPYEGTLHRVSAYYLSTGITADKLEDISTEEAVGLMAAHGKAITKAVAVAWLNGYWSGKLLTTPLAWYMRWHCKPAEICTIALMLLLYGGTSDFINTTRSVRMMKITSPRLGQNQGS